MTSPDSPVIGYRRTRPNFVREPVKRGRIALGIHAGILIICWIWATVYFYTLLREDDGDLGGLLVFAYCLQATVLAIFIAFHVWSILDRRQGPAWTLVMLYGAALVFSGCGLVASIAQLVHIWGWGNKVHAWEDVVVAGIFTAFSASGLSFSIVRLVGVRRAKGVLAA